MKFLFHEALRSLFRRFSHNILTLIAVLLSAATFTVLLGITDSSAAQTARRFQALETPILSAILPADSWEESETWIERQATQFHHVQNAGTFSMMDTDSPLIIRSSQYHTTSSVSVAIAGKGGLKARGAQLITGHLCPDSSNELSCAVLGQQVAKQLGTQPGSYIDVKNVQMRVMGIIHDSATESSLAAALILSPRTARSLKLYPTERTVIARVTPHSAEIVGSRLAQALSPTQPENVTIKYPANPEKLRAQFASDSQTLITVTATIMAVVTAFSIVNTMQIAVSQRKSEIGLDLALGLSRKSIAGKFLIESTFLGLSGSLIGTLLGSLFVAIVTMLNQWPFLLPPFIALIPVFGLVLGALGGVIPAIMASRVNPVELLHST